VRENSGAVRRLLRCHKYSKFSHTANKCRSIEKFPHTCAGEVNEFTEVTEVIEIMSCFNCGREGHVAKNCRQGTVCKQCGMKGHIQNTFGVLNTGWTKSEIEGREFVSNPRTTQAKEQ